MADEVRRVAAKGCHAVTFSENPAKLKLPSFHCDHWDPFWSACSRRGDDRLPPHRIVVVAGGHRPRRAHRRPHRAAAGEHRPGRRRPAVVAGAPEVPRPPGGAVRRRDRLDPVLPRPDGLDLHPPPRLDGPGLRYQAPQPRSSPSRSSLCFIDDPAGLELRHRVGMDKICWEADYPHSDSTWPHLPGDPLGLARRGPRRGHREVTHRNAMRHFRFDPFAHRPKEQCTVGALRAQAVDVDVTPRPWQPGRRAQDDQGLRPDPPSRHQ